MRGLVQELFKAKLFSCFQVSVNTIWQTFALSLISLVSLKQFFESELPIHLCALCRLFSLLDLTSLI